MKFILYLIENEVTINNMEFTMDLVRAEYENRLNDWKYIIYI